MSEQQQKPVSHGEEMGTQHRQCVPSPGEEKDSEGLSAAPGCGVGHLGPCRDSWVTECSTGASESPGTAVPSSPGDSNAILPWDSNAILPWALPGLGSPLGHRAQGGEAVHPEGFILFSRENGEGAQKVTLAGYSKKAKGSGGWQPLQRAGMCP